MPRFERSTARLTSTAMLFAAVLAGCGGDKGTGPSSISGTYALQTVNGAALPTTAAATVGGTSYSARFVAGCCSVTLNSDGTYQRSVSAQVTQSGLPISVPVVADDHGTYTANAGSLRFISALSNVTVAGQAFSSAQVDTSVATVSDKRLTFLSDAALGVTGTLLFVRK